MISTDLVDPVYFCIYNYWHSHEGFRVGVKYIYTRQV